MDEALNQRLHLFKLHNPYFESDLPSSDMMVVLRGNTNHSVGHSVSGG